MKRFLTFIFVLFVPAAWAFGDECINFKTTPDVMVNTPAWEKEVVQPLKPMDLLHGNVIASLTETYSLEVEMESVEDGYCVVLKNVGALVGYTDFLVQIDSRHIPGSCSYNLTLAHEDQHILAYLGVIDDNADEIKTAVSDAAMSIMPMFAKNKKDANAAVDKINEEIQKHPAVVLMRQKIHAEEDIRNKKIDQGQDRFKINECFSKQ